MKEIQRKCTELGFESCLVPEKDGWIFDMVLGFVKPKNILEIGFYRGGSAFMMLSLAENAKVTSVDPIFNVTDEMLGNDPNGDHHKTEYLCVEKMKKEFPDRFTFINKRSQRVRPDLAGQKFDFMFIDGDHWEEGARNDYQLALDLKIPYVLVDDFAQPQNGPKATPTVFFESFANKFEIMTAFYRQDSFQGSRIPMVLLKNIS